MEMAWKLVMTWVTLLFVKDIRCDTGYINCTDGTLNVILTAPHGGYEEPASIPDRDAGCYIDGECVWNHTCGQKNISMCYAVVESDYATQELTVLIAGYLEQTLGERPTTAINLLKRTKLDANRNLSQASFGEDLAVQAWYEFHDCIDRAKSRIEATSPRGGLYFDVHGHSHPIIRAELGYLISGELLDNGPVKASDTSIRHLNDIFDGDFETILRGDKSFGYYLELEQYKAVPSPTYKGPGGERYFSGNFNTLRHGSVSGGKIDGIQLENAYPNRKESRRNAYARAVANAIINFRKEHYLVNNVNKGNELTGNVAVWLLIPAIMSYLITDQVY